jgi:hypothetical protein
LERLLGKNIETLFFKGLNMRKIAYTDEDLTSVVKEVIKEAVEAEESVDMAESGEIVDIANKMDIDEVSDEPEAEVISLEMDALVNLVGEETAQMLYDKCCENGPSIPLTAADVEECCPESDEAMEDDIDDIEGMDMPENSEESFGDLGAAEDDEAEAEVNVDDVDDDIEAMGACMGGMDGCGATTTGGIAAGEDEVDVEAGEDHTQALEGSAAPGGEEIVAGADVEVDTGDPKDIEAGADDVEAGGAGCDDVEAGTDDPKDIEAGAE